MRVLGFMSGTSLDGVDAAVIETDGERVDAFGPTALIGFTGEQRDALARATTDALAWNGTGAVPASFAEAERVIHDTHVAAARQVIEQGGGAIDLIGFHGQTVLHRPERSLSVQLGDAGALATTLGIPVVSDLRQGDLAAGGQGAPIVPIYHVALVDRISAPRPFGLLNIGGVANLTLVGSGDLLAAFDTGPGNGLIDQIVEARGAGTLDVDGRLASAGTVDRAALDALLALPFFARTGPKSVDRYDFPLAAVERLSIEDAAATLTAFTAEAVVLAVSRLPEQPRAWLICGGGRHNPAMMRALRERLGECRSADDYGLRGDFMEAEAMAFLAARSTRGLPLTYPGTTGVAQPVTGGRLTRP